MSTRYKAFLPDWFHYVWADSEEEAQRIAARFFQGWLADEPQRVIVWSDPERVTAGKGESQ